MAARTASGRSRETVETGTRAGDGDDLRGRCTRLSALLSRRTRARTLRLPRTHVEVLGTRVVGAVHDGTDREGQSHTELVAGRATATATTHC